MPRRPACSAIRVELVLGRVEQAAVGGVRHRRQHEQVAEPVEQVHGEPARIMAGLDHAIDRAVDRSRVAGGESVDHVVEQRDVGDARADRPSARR